MSYGIIVVLICLIIGSFLAIFIEYRKRHMVVYEEDPIETMDGREFEFFCAQLLQENGFSEVEVTKGSGDYGVDVLAQKDDITYAIQCKRYDAPVGVKAVQEAYAGKGFYDCMVAAVMTNQYFTQPAIEAAKKLKVLLWDCDKLQAMMGVEE